MRPFLVTFLCCVLVAACDPPSPGPSVQLRLVLAQDAACQPSGEVDALRIEALGDFPTTDRTVELLQVSADGVTADRFPAGTRWLTARASAFSVDSWSGAGAMAVSQAEAEQQLLLLPQERFCEVSSLNVTWWPRSAHGVLQSRYAVSAGGWDGAQASRQLAWLDGQDGSARRAEPSLLLRRLDAAGCEVSGQWIVAGGALQPDGPADDTYEVFDPILGGVDRSRSGTMQQARARHGCIAIEGSNRSKVLWVGGYVEQPSVPLRTIEQLDLQTGERVFQPDGLPVGLVDPQLLELDDGSVFVVGGYDASGTRNPHVGWLDPETLQVQWVASDWLNDATGGRAVALPGGRGAWFGGEPVRRQVPLFRRLPTIPTSPPTVVTRVVELSSDLPARDTRASVLPDGRVAVAGADALGQPARFYLDLSIPEAQPVSGPEAPFELVALQGGAIAELAASGASLRRDLLRLPWDSPPATVLVPGDNWLVLSHPDDWLQQPASWRAQRDHARLDFAGLSFRDFSLVLQASGPVELLLVPKHAPPVVVPLSDARAGPSSCEVERVAGAPLELVRTEQTVSLHAGGVTRSCPLDGLTEHVGVAVRAQQSSAVEQLEILRRAARD